MDDLDAQIEAGLSLEREGKEREAIEHFRALAERYPGNARVRFEYAGAYDFAGYEAEAIPIYQQALELGLSGEYLPRAYVQLGSSLRNVGQYQEAIRILDEGLARLPDYTPLRIFRAFALYSAGQSEKAIVDLLEALLAHPDSPALDGYGRAIRYYADEINSVKN
jgi:tetratricopeptide (TPR) repeat protein